MVKTAYRQWKHGVKIYTNFKLFFDSEDVFYYQNLAELNHVRNAIILIDEAQVLLDSRDWESLPREFKYKVAQHRKHRLDIYATTQEIGQVDLRLRSLVQEWEHCETYITFKKSWRFLDDKKDTLIHWYKRKLMDIDDFRSRKPDDTTTEVLKVKRFNFVSIFSRRLYDTNTSIGFKPYIYLCSVFQKSSNAKNLTRILDILPSNCRLPLIKQQKLPMKSAYPQKY